MSERSNLGVRVYLMAQGKGLRWKDSSARYTRFLEQAPDYKQLLKINEEPAIHRSARLFNEKGFEVNVVADAELLRLAGLVDVGITLAAPGDDLIVGLQNLLFEYFPPEERIIVALGDVIFSRAAVSLLATATNFEDWGCMARINPNIASAKKADEVFAIWFHRDRWPTVLNRIDQMRHGFRPSKPWAFPFLVSDALEVTNHAYNQHQGLKAIADDLLRIDDYTDDVDSPEEWMQFWDAIKAEAEVDI